MAFGPETYLEALTRDSSKACAVGDMCSCVLLEIAPRVVDDNAAVCHVEVLRTGCVPSRSLFTTDTSHRSPARNRLHCDVIRCRSSRTSVVRLRSPMAYDDPEPLH